MACDVFLVQTPRLAEDFGGLDSPPQVVHALPECLDTGLAVAFAPDEAAEHGDQTHDFLELRSGRRFLAMQRVGTGLTPAGASISLASTTLACTVPLWSSGSSVRSTRSCWRTRRAWTPWRAAMSNSIRADQPVRWMPQIARPAHELDDVALASATYTSRVPGICLACSATRS